MHHAQQYHQHYCILWREVLREYLYHSKLLHWLVGSYDNVVFVYVINIFLLYKIATLFLIATVIGSFASGWISDRMGRKLAMVWSGIPLALSWLVMGLSTNSVMIYVSSFCQGFFASISWTPGGKTKIS